MKPFPTLIGFAIALSASTALARPQATDHSAHHPPASPATAATQANTGFVNGEVRRVDLDAKKLTLRHAPIPNLDMPEMTMVFQVADAKLLEGLKAGDKVRFKADRVGGQLAVTAIEMAP